MEVGFQIAIVSGISDSLSCTPDSKAKIPDSKSKKFSHWCWPWKTPWDKIADFKLRHNLSLTINTTLSSRIPDIPNKGDWARRNILKLFQKSSSLRRRRLEVVGERENGRVRGRHARGELPLPSRPFSLVSTTSKCLLRRLKTLQHIYKALG